jgi:hypothetical protein
MRRKWALYGLSLLAAALAGLATFSPAAAQEGRPRLPDEQQHGTEHFLIHYTLSGQDGVDPADGNQNGLPDYVEQVAEALEFSWQTEVEEYGWAPPPADFGSGGDDRIDVYIEDIMGEGYAGYADSEGGYVGDNPNTPETEHHAYHSYLGLDNDYVEVLDDPITEETPTQLMQATVAHEFNHVLQGGYDDNDPHFWLYEATATWMEDEVYPDVNDGVYYLDSLFGSPDTCLVAELPVREGTAHWYATWLFLRMLSERYGREVVRTMWEESRLLDSFESIDAALAPHGETLDSATRDFAVANLLRAYQEGQLYPAVYVEGQIGSGTFRPGDGVQSLGVDYVRLTGQGVTSVRLTDPEARFTLYAVGLRGAKADVIEGDGSTLVIDLDQYSEAFALVHNDERIGHEQACFLADYTLEVAPGGADLSPVAAVWPADKYVNPETGVPDFVGSADYQPPEGRPYNDGEYAEDAESLDVPFDTLVPASLPPGYSFDYAYIMAADEFGDNMIYYVPGGGDSANYDYLDESGNWLSIAESPSPYGTLDEWLAGIDYDTPGTIQTIDDVEVLIEDLGEPDDPWISATLILNGLFIVVDGDHTEAEVVGLVEGLIQAANAGPVEPAPVDLPAQGQAGPVESGSGPSTNNSALSGLMARPGAALGAALCGVGLCLAVIAIPLIMLGVRARRG